VSGQQKLLFFQATGIRLPVNMNTHFLATRV